VKGRGRGREGREGRGGEEKGGGEGWAPIAEKSATPLAPLLYATYALTGIERC
jgi:hypothetical protein